MAMRFHIQYYAALREAVGLGEETVQSAATTAADLYREIARNHGITFDLSILTVALNDRVVPWTSPVHDGDTLVFLAPFAGG
jgi:molybdopterin converting factor small subunit